MSPWIRLWRLASPFRLRLAIAAGCAASASLFCLASPLMTERLFRQAGLSSGIAPLTAPAGLLVAVACFQALAAYLNNLTLGGVGLQVVRGLRGELFRRLQSFPMAWFDRTPAGVAISRIMDDVSAIGGLFSGQSMSIVIELGTAFGVAIWLGMHSLRLLIVLVVLMPLYYWLFRRFASRIQSGALEVRGRLDQVFSRLKQKIDGIQVIRATAEENAEIAAFTQQIHDLHEPRLHVNQDAIAFSNLATGIGGGGAALLFAAGAWEVAAGRLTSGQLVAASAMAGLLFTPIARLSDLTTLFQQASASLLRIAELLDAPLDAETIVNEPEVIDCVASGDHSIEFDAVDFDYSPERPTLRDISLRIPQGAKVAIVGPTGSGKSTLMNLLLRFYRPSRGEVRLHGAPIQNLSESELRRKIGLVPQEPVVFRGSLAENIAYGSPDADELRILAAAKAAGVDEFAEELSDRYETLIGEGGYPLSQGQKQRIAIARVFCKNPSIVILDEATSALDRANEVQVQDALDRLFSGRTTMVIAHRLATIVDADLIVVMDHGRIAQIGSHTDLLAEHGGLYHKLYRSQMAAVASTPESLSTIEAADDGANSMAPSASLFSNPELVPA